jgi:hypothetical protein
VDEDTVLGHHTDLDPAAGQQVMQPTITVAMQQRLDLGGRFIPTLH